MQNQLTDLISQEEYKEFAEISENLLNLLCTLFAGIEDMISNNQTDLFKATFTQVIPNVVMYIFSKDISKPSENTCTFSMQPFEKTKKSNLESRYCIVQRLVSTITLQ